MKRLAGWANAHLAHRLLRIVLALIGLTLTATAGQAQIRIVAVGDSSFKGGPSMRDLNDTYPARLEVALRAKGYNVTVANQGINGERAWQTVERLNVAVPNGTRIALVAVGINDMVYEHANRAMAFARLKDIVARLRTRGIEVMVFNLGAAGGAVSREQVAAETEALQALGAIAVPPMQAGLVNRKELHVETAWKPHTTQWHLNREGNDIVVQRTLPVIEKLIARVQ
ncbi:MAG: hypothetical protein KGL55_07330 [Rhodospirillales bacterium]|nr:hypothetical protein [Rhodospirillales bacterium]MDE2575107.1 hypothetical protein [Rhodospirillales bacterium]